MSAFSEWWDENGDFSIDTTVAESVFNAGWVAARTIERQRKLELGEAAPPCPECGADMEVKTGFKGDFYGCSQWRETKCKGSYNIRKETQKEIEW